MGDDTIKPPRASWSPSPQDAYIAQLEQEIIVLKRRIAQLVEALKGRR